eukprot:CFRG0093T1
MSTQEVMMGIGALPYVDTHYNDEDSIAAVEAIIEQECSLFPITSKNYLSYLGPEYTPNFNSSELLRNEYARVCAGKPMDPYNVHRYKVDEPTTATSKPETWKKSINHAAAQLEMQNDRVINLELLGRFGKIAWLEHTKELEMVKDNIQGQLESVTNSISELNAARGVEQADAGVRLRDLDAQLASYIDQSCEVQMAICKLEKEVKALREQAVERGVLKN